MWNLLSGTLQSYIAKKPDFLRLILISETFPIVLVIKTKIVSTYVSIKWKTLGILEK